MNLNRIDCTKDLNMKEVCSKIIWKNLSSKHQMWRKETCLGLLARLLEKLSVLENIVNDYETWGVLIQPRNKMPKSLME
jgi:hypothetical protein